MSHKHNDIDPSHLQWLITWHASKYKVHKTPPGVHHHRNGGTLSRMSVLCSFQRDVEEEVSGADLPSLPADVRGHHGPQAWVQGHSGHSPSYPGASQQTVVVDLKNGWVGRLILRSTCALRTCSRNGFIIVWFSPVVNLLPEEKSKPALYSIYIHI